MRALQSEATFEVPAGLEPCGIIFIEAATQAYMNLDDYYQTTDVAAIAIVSVHACGVLYARLQVLAAPVHDPSLCPITASPE